jgi:hypothetical protein
MMPPDAAQTVSPLVLECTLSGLADATVALRTELAANHHALEAGLGRVMEAASLLRHDAVRTGLAQDRRAAEEAADHAAHLARLESTAGMVQARLEAAGQALDQSAVPDGAAPLAAVPVLLGRLEAATEGASALLARITAEAGGGGRTLADLRQAASQIAQAAARLEDAGARQNRAGEAVALAARAAVAAATAQPGQDSAPLAGLDTLAGQTAALLAEASSLADSAAKGTTLPAVFQAQTPALLAAIDGNIQRLRGAATALALASDATQQAA